MLLKFSSCPDTDSDCQKHVYPSFIISLRLLALFKVQVMSVLPSSYHWDFSRCSKSRWADLYLRRCEKSEVSGQTLVSCCPNRYSVGLREQILWTEVVDENGECSWSRPNSHPIVTPARGIATGKNVCQIVRRCNAGSGVCIVTPNQTFVLWHRIRRLYCDTESDVCIVTPNQTYVLWHWIRHVYRNTESDVCIVTLNQTCVL